MADRWLPGAGLVALVAAGALLLDPRVPVGLSGTEPAPGLLFLLLVWGGTGLVAAGPLPRRRWDGAFAVVIAMLAALPFYLFLPDRDPASILVLGAAGTHFVLAPAVHLVLAPAVARVVRADAALVRRVAGLSGVVHAGLLAVPARHASGGQASAMLIAAAVAGLLAWGLGTIGSLVVRRGTGTTDDEAPGDAPRALGGLLLAAAVVQFSLGAHFPPASLVLQAVLLLLAGATLGVGVWALARNAS